MTRLGIALISLALPSMATADSIMFTVEGLRSGEGTLGYQLCEASEFDAALREGQPCAIQGYIEAQDEVTQFGLNLEGGTFAVILRHDENRDGLAKGLGLSNNPDLGQNLIDFDAAAIEIEGRMGADIKLSYSD